MANDLEREMRGLYLGQVKVNVEEAHKGSPYAAKWLYQEASKLLASGEALPIELALWLSERLAAVTEATNLAKALQLNTKQAKPFKEQDFEMLVAQDVYYEIGKHGHHKAYTSSKDGPEATGAYSIIGEKHDLSPNTVEKYYLRYRKVLKHYDEIKEENQPDQLDE